MPVWFEDLEQFLDSDELKHTHFRKGTSRYASRGKIIPRWTKSDRNIQALLLRVFPKLKQDERQRKAAARWALVIYLYYRTGSTYREIAEELHMNYGAAHQLLKRISRAAAGMETHRGKKPRHRA